MKIKKKNKEAEVDGFLFYNFFSSLRFFFSKKKNSVYGSSQMAKFLCLKSFLHLTILYFLTQRSTAQKEEETDRVIKKRGEDAWFLENSVCYFFLFIIDLCIGFCVFYLFPFPILIVYVQFSKTIFSPYTSIIQIAIKTISINFFLFFFFLF